MTGIAGQLEAKPGAERYPDRHDVHEALLVRGAERAERIARHLLARGIDTPEPLGLEVTPGESVRIVRKVERSVPIRAFLLRRDEPGREPPAVGTSFDEAVTALARLARRLHDARVFFRDFTDGNVLVTEGDAGPRLWLVDLDRARVRKGPLGTFTRLRDLARPGLNREEDRQLPLRAYFEPSPVPAGVSALHAVLRRRIVAWNRLKRLLRPWRR